VRTAVTQRTVNRAAAQSGELNIPQSTASRTIATLEREIGVALFVRTTRAVTLTDAGLEFLARIESVLAELDEAEHAARGTGELRGNIADRFGNDLCCARSHRPAFELHGPASGAADRPDDGRRARRPRGRRCGRRASVWSSFRLDGDGAENSRMAAGLAARRVPSGIRERRTHSAVAGMGRGHGRTQRRLCERQSRQAISASVCRLLDRSDTRD
jgi:hypothetical protein